MNEARRTDTSSIQRFIGRFTEHGEQITQCFTNGCCYWFARILQERFSPDGEIVYDDIDGHFAFRLGDSVYDVTGDVTGKAEWVSWANYEIGSGHRVGIVRDCILFNETAD